MTTEEILAELRANFWRMKPTRRKQLLESKFMADIRDQLRAAIQTDDRTVNAIGVAAKVPPASIYRFMDGKRELTFESAAKLCTALGLVLVQAEQPKPKPMKRTRANRT